MDKKSSDIAIGPGARPKVVGRIITEDELVRVFARTNTLMHLAKTHIAAGDRLVQSHTQMYALGYNIGGRPDGLWLSRGSAWIQRARELDNPRYPVCCYLYEVELRPDARILTLRTREDFDAFDAKFPNYWLNMDYYEIDFVDYATDKPVQGHRDRPLMFDKLRRRPGMSTRDTLIANGIIFTSAEEARAGCAFYRTNDVERFRYKDWNAVAQVYQGIVFDFWDINDKYMMSHMWFQSLDVASACIWDTSAISATTLRARVVGPKSWELIVD